MSSLPGPSFRPSDDDETSYHTDKSRDAQRAIPISCLAKVWAWELAALGAATGLVAAIFAILAHFQGQQLPSWPFQINLNTLVSLLATIMRALLVFPVASVIGQSKWLWYHRNRPLAHMNDFDQASRGPTGSLKLLFTAPTSLYGVVGALVTICSFAIGPFIQQAIGTTPCVQTIPDGLSAVPVAHFAPGTASNDTDLFDDGGSVFPSFGTMAAMTDGMANPTGKDSAIGATCSTGNCTFPYDSEGVSYSSIGVCSICLDTTPLVTLSRIGNFTLPDDQWVAMTYANKYVDVRVSPDLSWASTAFTDEFENAARRSISNFTILSLTSTWCIDESNPAGCPANVTAQYPLWHNATGIVATTCTLYACLKNYRAEVKLGILNETIVSTVPATGNWEPMPAWGNWEGNIPPSNEDDNAPRLNFTAVKTPCTIDDTEYNVSTFGSVPRTPGRPFVAVTTPDNASTYDAPAECVYRMDGWYGTRMQVFIWRTLFMPGGGCEGDGYRAGNWWNTTFECGSITPGPQSTTTLAGNSWWLGPLYNAGMATPQSLSRSLDLFATAVTNYLRTTGGELVTYEDIPREWAHGTAQQMTVCTTIQWDWLLVPLGLVVISMGLVASMIIHGYTSHLPTWKNSPLPLIFYGLEHAKHLAADSQTATDLKEMEYMASQTRVRFQSARDAGFVLATRGNCDLPIR